MQSEDHRWIYLVRFCGYDVSPSDYPLGAHCVLEAPMASRPESPKDMSAEQNFIHTHDSRWLSTVTIYKSSSYLPSFFDFVDYDACKLHLHVVDEVARGYNDWRKISKSWRSLPQFIDSECRDSSRVWHHENIQPTRPNHHPYCARLVTR